MANLTFHKTDEHKWEVRKGVDKIMLGYVENNGTRPFFFKAALVNNVEAVLLPEDFRELATYMEQQ
jgi:hypothetical protein